MVVCGQLRDITTLAPVKQAPGQPLSRSLVGVITGLVAVEKCLITAENRAPILRSYIP